MLFENGYGDIADMLSKSGEKGRKRISSIHSLDTLTRLKNKDKTPPICIYTPSNSPGSRRQKTPTSHPRGFGE
jgi:hypothetical protein